MIGKLLIAVLVLALTIPSASGEEVITSENLDTVIEESQNGGGIINFFLKPIKATIKGATTLLGLPIKGVKNLVLTGYDEVQVRAFKLFMKAYNKVYSSPAELRRRMEIFFERRKMIQESIREFAAGRLTYTMRENAFADLDENEMKAMARALPPKTYQQMDEEERAIMIPADDGHEELKKRQEIVDEQSGDIIISVEDETRVNSSRYVTDIDRNDNNDTTLIDNSGLTVTATERIPLRKDWRLSGCVGKPMDQGNCGACYAVATMNTLETMHCLKGSKSPTLSTQQLVDCSTKYGNYGCDGGWPTRVLNYLKDARVAATHSCYPYVRREQSCNLPRIQYRSNCAVSSSYTNTKLQFKVLNNENDILYYVGTNGPVITAVKTLTSFLLYDKGIYDDWRCSGRRSDVDHAVSIVGYGRENNVDYWIVKNSWGEDWGEKGYAKFRRGKQTCSIGHWGWAITA